ncbi:hypothetical protein [Amycolatopsis sp.]|uniref:hypothetical protein n=1 Tax=Amycolatopsis sp. TaxID=37632 RepID=UPI002E1846B6
MKVHPVLLPRSGRKREFVIRPDLGVSPDLERSQPVHRVHDEQRRRGIRPEVSILWRLSLIEIFKAPSSGSLKKAVAVSCGSPLTRSIVAKTPVCWSRRSRCETGIVPSRDKFAPFRP